MAEHAVVLTGPFVCSACKQVWPCESERQRSEDLGLLLLNLVEAAERARDALEPLARQVPDRINFTTSYGGAYERVDYALRALKEPLRLARERLTREEASDG